MHDALEMIVCEPSYSSSLTPSTIVMSSPVAGAEMMTFFAPRVDVLARVLGLGEQPGRLDDDVDAEVPPRQRARAAALGQPDDRLAVDRDPVVGDLDRRAGSRPSTLSYFSRCAIVLVSARSL